MRKIYTLIPVMLFSFTLTAQNNFFSATKETDIPVTAGKRMIIPESYKVSALNVTGLRTFLWSLPSEKIVQNRLQTSQVMELPMPDGSNAKFRVWESTIMEPLLAAKFPGVKTFTGQGIDDPTATIRMDWTARGFHAMVLSDIKGNVFIDPYRQGDQNNYTIYFKKDLAYTKNFFEENYPQVDAITGIQAREQAGPCVGTQLRTYRLALACTAEYAAAVSSPSAPDATLTFSAMVTSVNRVVGVYEKELAVRMVLINNNANLIYLSDPDPYSNNNGSAMLDQNQNNIDAVIGPDNYDIGHVFSTGGGGVAVLNGPCGGNKAKGVTGLSNPTGDAFDIDFVAHEMGHQFGGTHTFNATTNNCGGGNRTASTAMEPGSGITIMAYAGICGATNNLSAHSIPTFHGISFDQISNFTSSGGGSSCPVLTPIVNNIPVVNAGSNFTIPISTAFVLTGSATDADAGDLLTYSWEEMDAGPSGNWNSPTGNAPLFRSFLPVSVPERHFPQLSDQNNNVTTVGELLPTYARTMNFRLTARDNHAGGGGVCFSEMQVTVDGSSGPFAVSVPSASGISWAANSTQTVSWNVANTNNAPISCANVSILLSIDGGNTYPITILGSTPNDGSEVITVPGNVTNLARIRVKAVGNIFYDISDNNFTISAPATGFGFDNPAAASVACAGPTSANITLGTTSFSGYSTPINLTASGVPVGATVSFAPNPVVPGNSTVVTLNNTNLLSNGTYTITVTGTSGTLIQTKSLTYIIQAGTGPAITVQPQPQAVCSATTATFTVTAPAGISYQWQVSTNGGGSFSDINGATLATLSLPGVTAALNNNQYRVIVRGQCNTTTSAAATLTVSASTFITNQPQNATLCVNSDATFNVAATGAGLTYQWQLSTNGGASFNNIASATSNSYTQTGVTAAMNNYQYRVIVSGSCATPATSNIATLTVVSPVTISAQPGDFTICETGNATFTVAGTGAATIIYQWQVSTNGGTSYTNLLAADNVYSGVSSATLTITAVTPALNNNRYRALLSNATCPTPAASNGAILTVNAKPTVTLSSPLTNLLPGQSTTITAAILPSAAGFTISWFKNGNIIPGVTGTTYLVDSVETGEYKVKIVNQTTGCSNESQVLIIGTTSSQRLYVFPSPNDGRFTISYYNSNGTATQQTISVFDARGAQVYYANVAVNGPYTLHTVNLRGAARGVYLVVVGDSKGKRLAKEKIVIN